MANLGAGIQRDICTTCLTSSNSLIQILTAEAPSAEKEILG